MSRSRSYRRHKRRVKLARRYRILMQTGWRYAPELCVPQARHYHLCCHCWDWCEKPHRRLREGRAWRELEDVAW